MGLFILLQYKFADAQSSSPFLNIPDTFGAYSKNSNVFSDTIQSLRPAEPVQLVRIKEGEDNYNFACIYYWLRTNVSFIDKSAFHKTEWKKVFKQTKQYNCFVVIITILKQGTITDSLKTVFFQWDGDRFHKDTLSFSCSREKNGGPALFLSTHNTYYAVKK